MKKNNFTPRRFFPMILLSFFAISSCNNEIGDKKDAPLEYIYIDARGILHIDNKCEDICKIPNVGTRPVDVYPVFQIYYVEYNHICATCTDEKYFDQLCINTTNNLKKYYVMAKNTYDDVGTYEDFVRYLEYNAQPFYNDIQKKGHVMPPYHEFRREIAHPNQIAIDNQRKVYNALRKEHADIPDDFRDFQSIISDTNTLKVYYEKLKHEELFFPGEFKDFIVDLGLDPNQPAQLKLLLPLE